MNETANASECEPCNKQTRLSRTGRAISTFFIKFNTPNQERHVRVLFSPDKTFPQIPVTSLLVYNYPKTAWALNWKTHISFSSKNSHPACKKAT